MHCDAAAQGLADRVRPVVADVSSWRPIDRGVFDIVVATYLHIGLSVLVDSADLLALGAACFGSLTHQPARVVRLRSFAILSPTFVRDWQR